MQVMIFWTVKMEAAWSSETVITYHNPEDCNMNFHCYENLICFIIPQLVS